jgi:hypothetical protein
MEKAGSALKIRDLRGHKAKSKDRKKQAQKANISTSQEIKKPSATNLQTG